MAADGTGRIGDAEALLGSKDVFGASGAEKAATGSAIQYFMNAAMQIDYNSSTGLALYKNEMANVKDDIISNYQQAIATLRPQEKASRDALDEMMRFTGIDPVQATVGMTDNITGIKGLEGSKLSDLIRQAQNEKDPAQRALLKDQINAEFDNSQQIAKTAREQAIEQQIAALPKPTRGATPTQPEWSSASGRFKDIYNASEYGGKMGQQEVDAYKRQVADWTDKVNASNTVYNKQLADYEQRKKEIETQVTDSSGMLSDLKSQFMNSYTPEYDKAYTGAQVIEKLEATPGYQFQMDAGTKAIERQGASKGMLGSGNTLLGLQQYGQDLAQGYYQSHLANLEKIAAQGSGAATGIANLFAQKGTLLSSIAEKVGAQSANTYDLIGQGYAAAYNKAGEAEFASSQQFAADKFAAQESAKQRAMDIAGKIIGAEPANRQLDQAAGAAQGALAAAQGAKKSTETSSKFYTDANGRIQSTSNQQGGVGYLNPAGTSVLGAKPVPGAQAAAATAGASGGNISV